MTLTLTFNPFQMAPFTQRHRQESERLQRLTRPQAVPVTNAKTSNVTLYTAKSDQYFHIQRFVACTVGNGSVAIDVWFVPDGGTPDDSNVVLDSYELVDQSGLKLEDQKGVLLLETGDVLLLEPGTVNAAVSERLTALEGALLEPGTAIVVVSDNAASGVNFWLWGVDIEGGSISV